MIKKYLAAAVTAAAFFLMAHGSVALAQNTAALSDAEFNKFVSVNVELQKLIAQYEGAVKAAGEDAAQRAAVESELKEKSHQVLAKNEVTPERYREIYKIVDADPELRTKALLQIEQQGRKE
jgi:hypothetical protein